MIQRIQSLYFSLAIICQLLFAFGTKFSGTTENEAFLFGMSGMVVNNELIRSDYKPLFLALIAAIILVVAIVSFKNHGRQIKLANAFVLIIFLQLFFLGLLYSELLELKSPEINIGWAVFLLPVACIFALLGKAGVKKDWKLLKSVDRIR